MTKQCDNAGEDEVLGPYLYRRADGKSASIYVRMTVPTELRHLVPTDRWHFRISLKTTDANEAKLRAGPIIHSKLREWSALRKQVESKTKAAFPTVRPEWSTTSSVSSVSPQSFQPEPALLTEQLIENIIAARLHSWMLTDNSDRYGSHGFDDEEFAEIESFCKSTDSAMRSVIARGTSSPSYPAVVEEVLEWCLVQTLIVDKNDPLFILLIRRYAEAEKKMQEFIAARNKGDSPEMERVLPKSKPRLSAMLEQYQKHKSNIIGSHHLGTALNMFRLFIEFQGDVPLDDIVSNDIYKFIEHHLFSTKRWSQNYADTKVPRYLRDVFALARTQNLMSVANPVAGLERTPQLPQREKKARLKPRYPLTTNHLNKLFSSEWYNPSSKLWTGKLSSDLGVRYFAPLIGLLHGPRVREPLQLMSNDVVLNDGILCFSFRIDFEDEDADEENFGFVVAKTQLAVDGQTAISSSKLPERSLKNSSVIRIIPVHPKLIELGFADFVHQRKIAVGNVGPLFPSSLPEPGGKSPKWGRVYEQGILRFFKNKLGFSEGYGSHGMRHQFEDRIRAANVISVWPPGMAQYLSGRKLPRDADRGILREVASEAGYGSGYTPRAAVLYLSSLDFSDIKFPPKFSDWLSLNK